VSKIMDFTLKWLFAEQQRLLAGSTYHNTLDTALMVEELRQLLLWTKSLKV
jgi:hypothetical protein